MGAPPAQRKEMMMFRLIVVTLGLFVATSLTHAQPAEIANPAYDAALAQSLGADERGMRRYVLVILKTGQTRVPAGPERDEMFKGHFANINRLSAEGKLALAGPLDGVDGWRGLFVLAVPDIDEAKKLVAADPVIIKGEMVAEYHVHHGSAALMLVRDAHAKITKHTP
jgi:uncharacterized protein YciI